MKLTLLQVAVSFDAYVGLKSAGQTGGKKKSSLSRLRDKEPVRYSVVDGDICGLTAAGGATAPVPPKGGHVITIAITFLFIITSNIII